VDVAKRRYQEGLEALRSKDRRAAEARFREALEGPAGFAPARMELARLLIEERRLDEAARLLDDGLALAPADSALAQLRARLLLQDGALDRAAAVLRTAPPRLAEAPDHHALLAAIEQRRGRDDAAADLYRQLLALQPDAGQWHVGLGISLERLGARESAVDAYASGLADSRLSATLRRYAEARLSALRS
jgi:Tfp pilus assembly protein PilF